MIGPESPIEALLYEAMIDYGLLPICQYKIGRCRVDFAFLTERVVIEADGKKYHSSKRAKVRDFFRDRYLKKNGWRVMRFTGSQIYQDAYKCVREIRKELSK